MSGSSTVPTRRGFALGRTLLCCLLTGLPWACTLTQRDFEPAEVTRLDTEPAAGDAGTLVTQPAGCADGARCCSTDADCSATETCAAGLCAPSCSGAEDPSACELALCPGPGCPEPVASCTDGARNGREPAPDCGASCPTPCPVGSACGVDLDCVSGRCAGGACAAATCDDGVENQDEPAVDCGGSCPNPCPVGSPCTADADCGPGVSCSAATRRCTAASCQDGIQSGAETLVDCGGGTCPGCPPGSPCAGGADCDSQLCSQGLCATAACPDGVANGGESGLDCGGSDQACPRCPDGQACRGAADCASERCEDGLCASCSDGARNGAETGVDCGGGQCPRCPGGEACSIDEDCSDGDCSDGACLAPSCGDGAHNGTESDVDCGGADATCARCAPGAACQLDADCASGACEGGRCCGGALGDCTRCALRLSPNIDCDVPSAGVDGTGVINCGAFLSCLANNAQRCPTRNTPGCSGDDQANDACPHNDYGGNAGTGVTRANQVLTNAGCNL